MDWIVMGLILVVGALAGVLATLIIDGRTLGEQVKAAVSQNQRLQSKLRSATSRLAAAEAQIQTLTGELDKTSQQIAQLTTLNQTQQQELAAAAAEKSAIHAQFNRLNDQLDKLRAEHQLACRRLATAAVEIKHLRQNLDVGENQSQQLVQLQADKQLLERKAGDLQARLNAAQRQLDHAGLKGKSQIEIVRGIGPTYARRLHEAGIHNLSDLAQLTAERAGEIVGLKTWQRADPQAWIDEAAELAAAFSDGEHD